MDFNLQTFLSEMRDEQRENHQTLSMKIDEMRTTVSGHETRIVVVENARRSARWLGGAIVLGVISFVFDVLINHVPAWFKAH